MPWDDALKLMRQHMEAKNLRPGSLQQYEMVVSVLRKVFPDSQGPRHHPGNGPGFRGQANGGETGEKQLSPRTVEGNIGNLSIVFGHWFRDTLKIIKTTRLPTWSRQSTTRSHPGHYGRGKQGVLRLDAGDWDWRLPLLFLEVKAAIGCRIGELTSAVTAGLKDGRIRFVSETTKGRKSGPAGCRRPCSPSCKPLPAPPTCLSDSPTSFAKST